jgi:hypothetical protein
MGLLLKQKKGNSSVGTETKYELEDSGSIAANG